MYTLLAVCAMLPDQALSSLAEALVDRWHRRDRHGFSGGAFLAGSLLISIWGGPQRPMYGVFSAALMRGLQRRARSPE